MQRGRCLFLFFYTVRTTRSSALGLLRGLRIVKMIWAVLPPETADHVTRALHASGTGSLFRFPVTGYGREPDPAQPPTVRKELLLMVVPDNAVAKTVILIRSEAKAGAQAVAGKRPPVEGKIFVTYIDDAFAIRAFGTEREDIL